MDYVKFCKISNAGNLETRKCDLTKFDFTINYTLNEIHTNYEKKNYCGINLSI